MSTAINTNLTQAEKWKDCPECKRPNLYHEGYPYWCQHCEYGLVGERPKPKTLWDKVILHITVKYGEAFLQKIIAEKKHFYHKKLPSVSLLITYFIATVVHLLTLLCFGFAIFLPIHFSWHPISIVGSLFFLYVSYFLKPNFPKKPEEKLYSSKDLPFTFAVLDKIGKKLNTKATHEIAILQEYNAYYGIYGMKAKRVVGLGLPLINALTNKELLFVLGHEMGHGSHGDNSRSFYIFTSVLSLSKWHVILRPVTLWDSNIGFYALGAFPFLLLQLMLSYVIYGVVWLMAWLFYRSSQVDEFHADYSGYLIAGESDAQVALTKMHYGAYFEILVQKSALNREKDPYQLFARLRNKINELPENEKMRITKLIAKEKGSLDMTHPPTIYRQMALKMIDVPSFENVVTDFEIAQMRKELESKEKNTIDRLIDQYRRSLYD
ncbi:MAG: M48 family metalloprotease [Bdellovibrio sp.]|nr:M48 family metalloprotease [Bdellovibrio sp.]